MPARVLIVEDSPSVASVVLFVLEDAGYEAVVIGNGALAVADATSTPPAVILLDLAVPGLDGYGVCARLAEDERTRGIPIVLMTGSQQSASSERLAGYPIRDVIVKPFSPRDLLARVRAIIDRA